MITILHRGEGSLGTPKSDNEICARPLMYAIFKTSTTFPNFYKTQYVILFCDKTLLLLMEYKASCVKSKTSCKTTDRVETVNLFLDHRIIKCIKV